MIVYLRKIIFVFLLTLGGMLSIDMAIEMVRLSDTLLNLGGFAWGVFTVLFYIFSIVKIIKSK